MCFRLFRASPADSDSCPDFVEFKFSFCVCVCPLYRGYSLTCGESRRPIVGIGHRSRRKWQSGYCFCLSCNFYWVCVHFLLTSFVHTDYDIDAVVCVCVCVCVCVWEREIDRERERERRLRVGGKEGGGGTFSLSWFSWGFPRNIVFSFLTFQCIHASCISFSLLFFCAVSRSTFNLLSFHSPLGMAFATVFSWLPCPRHPQLKSWVTMSQLNHTRPTCTPDASYPASSRSVLFGWYSHELLLAFCLFFPLLPFFWHCVKCIVSHCSWSINHLSLCVRTRVCGNFFYSVFFFGLATGAFWCFIMQIKEHSGQNREPQTLSLSLSFFSFSFFSISDKRALLFICMTLFANLTILKTSVHEKKTAFIRR